MACRAIWRLTASCRRLATAGSGGELGKQGPAQAPEFAGTCRGERLPRAARSSTASACCAGDNILGASTIDIDDAFGVTLQAGVDIGLGDGWSLNLGVKKTWLDTTVTWYDNDALGGVNVVCDGDVDPWIFSAGRLSLQCRPSPKRKLPR